MEQEQDQEVASKENFFKEHKSLLVAAAAAVILAFFLLFNFIFSSKAINLSVNETSLQAGKNYEIRWTSSNVGRVGIALFDGQKGKMIVENYPAGARKYVWQSDPYQEAGTEYRFAVFEYPWKKGNAVAYSSQPVAIIGQKYVSCDSYAVEQSWPFLPDKHPGVLRAFITSTAFSGNLGGIEGADAKCAQEAQKNGYTGDYIALLGTDDISARERIAKDGVFVDASPAGISVEGRSCHRLIAENTQKLFDKMRLSRETAQVHFTPAFYQGFGNLWLGRMSPAIGDKCLLLGTFPKEGMIFSNSYTCQNWTIDRRQIYTSSPAPDANPTLCYDLEGKRITANHYGAAAVAIDGAQGSYVVGTATCDSRRRLLCVEQ